MAKVKSFSFVGLKLSLDNVKWLCGVAIVFILLGFSMAERFWEAGRWAFFLAMISLLFSVAASAVGLLLLPQLLEQTDETPSEAPVALLSPQANCRFVQALKCQGILFILGVCLLVFAIGHSTQERKFTFSLPFKFGSQ